MRRLMSIAALFLLAGCGGDPGAARGGAESAPGAARESAAPTAAAMSPPANGIVGQAAPAPGGSAAQGDRIAKQIAAARQVFEKETPTEEPDAEVLIAIVFSETAEDTPELLRGAADFPDYRAVSGAARRLGQLGVTTDDSVRALIDAATYSHNRNVTEAAADALRQLDPTKTVPALVMRLDEEWDYLGGGGAIRDVLNEVGPRHLPYLIDVVDKKTGAIPEVRAAAAFAAAKAGPPAAPVIPHLLDLLNGKMRNGYLAATALGEIGVRTDAVVAALLDEIRQKGRSREAAFEALKKLDPEAAVNSGYFNPE